MNAKLIVYYVMYYTSHMYSCIKKYKQNYKVKGFII